MSRSIGLLLTFLVALGLGAVFLITRERPEAGAATEPRAEAVGAHDADQRASSELQGGAAHTVQASSVSEQVESDERVAALPNPTLRGTIVLPAGTPADETLQIRIGDQGPFDVDPDGRFELGLEDRPKRQRVKLTGRYLYLAKDVFVELGESGEITLEPVLGCRLQVTVNTPLATTQDVLEETKLELSTWSSESARFERLDERAVATFNGVPAEGEWTVYARNPHLYDNRKGPLLMAPGQTLSVTVELIQGTRLSGVVRYSDGTPAEDCDVTLRCFSEAGLSTALTSTETCDEEGAFSFEGQVPGRYGLVANDGGMAQASLTIGHLEDGEERTDIEVVLDEGHDLAGVVTWPEGRPAEGALVRIRGRRHAGRSLKATTDADGRFEAVALADPPYRVRAQLDDDDGHTWRALVDSVQAGDLAIQLQLQPGNRVAGHVVDDAGDPIKSFTIRSQQVGGSKVLMRERFTDKQGRFVIDDLPEGTWDLTATASYHGTHIPRRVQLPSLAGAEWEIVLPRDAIASGRVLGSDGEPISKGDIHVSNERKTWKGRAKEDGSFQLRGLPSGPLTLRGSGPGQAPGPAVELHLQPGEERDGLELFAVPAGRVVGILHDSVVDREGRQIQLASADYTFSINATSDADGIFRFEDLPEGTYRVFFSFVNTGGLNQEWAEKYAARSETWIDVPQGAEVELIFGGPREGEITVYGQLLQNAEPLANQLVYAFPGEEGVDIPVTTAFAGDEGRFELYLPEPGRYSFSSAPGAPLAFGRQIEVPDATTFELTLELGRGSIAGTLFGSDGAPRAAHTLILRRTAAGAGSRRPGNMRRARTEDDGSFRFSALEDGAWELRTGGFGNDYQHRTEGIAILSDLVVEDGGDIEGVEVQLREGSVLTGTCRNAEGAAAVGAEVFVVYADGARMLSWTSEYVAWDGSFRVPAVDAGTVEVYAELAGLRSSTARIELSEGEEGYVELQFE